MAVIRNKFNRAQVLHHLVAKECLDPQAHGCSVFDGERLAIHLIGKDGLRMPDQFHVKDLIERMLLRFREFWLHRLFPFLVGSKDSILRSWLYPDKLYNLSHAHPSPLRNTRPAL